MTRSRPLDCKRLIGWNGLQFTLPASWEVIVSGAQHLLVERDFTPVLEIRWETGGNRSIEDIAEATRQRFAGTLNTLRRPVLPPQYESIPHLRGAEGLSWHDKGGIDGLLWQCPECNVLMFCHLFSQPETAQTEVTALLESMHCHADTDHPAIWSIQDFQLKLPAGFTFNDYTFAAGLSRLAFSDSSLQLQFCRLAPASARLAGNSLMQLLDTLQAGQYRDEVITDTPQLHECRDIPSTSSRLLARLRRRRPFHWGRIWHNTPHNRLLSVTAESVQPIDLTLVHNLCNHYEIIPLSQAASSLNQPR